MTVFAWLVAVVVVVIAALAGVATRVPALQGPVRRAVMSAEALLVLVTVVDLGLVARAQPADRPGSMVTHLGYAVATVGIVPLLAFRRPATERGDTDAEPEQASLWVVVVALVAAAICVVRLVQTR